MRSDAFGVVSMKVNKTQSMIHLIEAQMHTLTEKQDQFERQFQHFMGDISELVIANVCQRINQKPQKYIPTIADQISELKELTNQH